jgi:hypothetical protein
MKGTTATEQLLFDLMKADSEDAVVELLRRAGYWDDDAAWRYYNDEPDNFDRAGNQQRNPEAALVEKLVNSVDASLLRKAAEMGLDPRSPTAPTSSREAVAVFYEGAALGDVRSHQGSLAEWTDSQRREVSRDITMVVTGAKPEAGNPCISIADAGEGQSPEELPNTILSLSKGIKKGIAFVQGRFNMGGTGALRFCGRRNLQLVVSKRLPALAEREGVSTAWGFTVVRRDDPNDETRVSTYRYLAPLGSEAHPTHGDVLRVERRTLPIFPEGQKPYSREAEWGTLIKLYEYKTRARTHMFRRGGLQERLDILLPGLVLPIRLHECRDYRGEERSFETTLTGLEVRLADKDGRSANIEDSFPFTGDISIRGQDLTFTLYVFKAGKSETYKRSEGILFVLGGQTHANEADRFFRRKDVGMSYLASSLLVVLDCSRLQGRTLEDLFMNSRDRLADEELAHEILDELAEVLRKHQGLKLLRERRRQEEVSGKLADEKPLEDVLALLLRRSPSLARLFVTGARLANPFDTGESPAAEEFSGKPHPTYFRFKDRKAGEELARTAHLGQRFRLDFETDVENEYFRRSANPGEFDLKASLNGQSASLTHSLNLFNGLAHLNVTPPPEATTGDVVEVTVTVTDWTLIEEFVCKATLKVEAPVEPAGGTPGKRKEHNPPAPKGPQQPQPPGVAFPPIEWVTHDDWKREGWVRPMDEFSGLRATLADAADEETGITRYDFYVNADNIFLQAELKATKQEPSLVKAKFKYGMALVGLGALRAAPKSGNHKAAEDDEDDAREPTAEEYVALATDAVAPMLLPMIEGLGGLDLDEVEAGSGVSDLGESLTD